MARLINNSWVAATPPSGKTITNYSLENNGVQVIEVGNVLVANGVSVGDEAINTRVRAKYNDATYGPYSNVVTIAAVSAPAAPTTLAIGTPTSTTIPLTWTASVTAGITHYRIYLNGVLNNTVTAPATGGNVIGLTASTPYTNITVRAYNGTSESASSNAVNGTTAAGGLTPDPANEWPNQYFVDTNSDGTADSVNKASVHTGTIVAHSVGNAQVLTATAGFDISGIPFDNSVPVNGYIDITFTYKVSGSVQIYLENSNTNKVVLTTQATELAYSNTFQNLGAGAATQFWVVIPAIGDSIEISNFVAKNIVP